MLRHDQPPMTSDPAKLPPRMSKVQAVSSRENPLVLKLRRLAQDPLAYRKVGEVWLEGDHLCRAALARGVGVPLAVVTDTAWLGEHGSASGDDGIARQLSALARQADKVVVVPEALWKAFTGLESPAKLGFLLPLLAAQTVQPLASTVVLDRVQDAGNVGSILRTAAAMGVTQVLALKGTAGLWSPKVLRAGMGAHFGLHLLEQCAIDVLQALEVPLLATSLQTDHLLHEVVLPDPCAWVMGHEGQGVADDVMAHCALQVRIPQPGGEESLNVGAATAICLYEAMRRRLLKP